MIGLVVSLSVLFNEIYGVIALPEVLLDLASPGNNTKPPFLLNDYHLVATHNSTKELRYFLRSKLGAHMRDEWRARKV